MSNQPVNRRQFLGRLFRSAADSVTPDIGGADDPATATPATTPGQPRRVQRTDPATSATPPTAATSPAPSGADVSPAPPPVPSRDYVPFEQQLVAYIKPIDCLAYGPTVCTVCSERCPEPDVIQLTRLRPTVDTPACTGCGICHEVCPAPDNAVLIVPRFVVDAQTGG